MPRSKPAAAERSTNKRTHSDSEELHPVKKEECEPEPEVYACPSHIFIITKNTSGIAANHSSTTIAAYATYQVALYKVYALQVEIDDAGVFDGISDFNGGELEYSGDEFVEDDRTIFEIGGGPRDLNGFEFIMQKMKLRPPGSEKDPVHSEDDRESEDWKDDKKVKKEEEEEDKKVKIEKNDNQVKKEKNDKVKKEKHGKKVKKEKDDEKE